MKKYYFLPELLLFILTVLITVLLTRNINLFGDDFITIEQIRNYNMLDLIKNLRFDAHPPLFYILLKLYSYLFGTSILALKSFNILGYFALIGAIYYLGYKIEGLKLARTSAFGLVLLPSLLNNPILFIRSYLISPFFALLMAGYAYLVYTQPSKKNSILFVIFSICACFTHYYVTFLTGIIHLILYFCLLRQSKNNWKKCFSFSIPCILIFAIWSPILYLQFLEKKESISDSTSFLSRMAKSIIYPFYTGTHLPIKNYAAYITSVALLLVFIYIIVKFLRDYQRIKLEKNEINAIFISLLLPISIMILLIIVGYITKPIWYSTYINLYIPIVVFGVSWILCKMYNKTLIYVWFSILSICFAQKLYLQAIMCMDDGCLQYENLYTNGVIKSSDIIIKANEYSCVYFPNVKQYNDRLDPSMIGYKFFSDHIKVVNNYDSLLVNKTHFFSCYKLDSVRYSSLFNMGYKLEKEFDFEMKYFDYESNSMFLYSKEDTEIR